VLWGFYVSKRIIRRKAGAQTTKLQWLSVLRVLYLRVLYLDTPPS
jgi:hypothetical protein